LTDPTAKIYRYHAYLASGLTGIRGLARAHLSKVRDIIEAACESRGIKAYRPELRTHPDDFPTVSPEEVWDIDRREAPRSDLLILHADAPTTGGGMEYEFARAARMPALVVADVQTEVSKMILGAPMRKEVVRYSALDEVRAVVETGIDKLWDGIVDRNEIVMADASNTLGERIKMFRVRKGWSQEDFAFELGTNAQDVSYYEEATDGASNLSVPGLKFMSTILGVTLQELIASETEVNGFDTGAVSGFEGGTVWSRSSRSDAETQSGRMSPRDRRTIEDWLRAHPG
jgi:transcriptional regulator with XRE-family HTH domain